MKLALIVIAAIAAALASQQTPVRDAPARPTTGTAVIGGVVTAAGDNPSPIRRARVMLRSSDGSAEPQTATTNDEGRFEFRGLPAGRFTINVQKPGYLSASYGAPRPLRAGSPVSVADGARVTNLAIRVQRGAVLNGTVRDSRGRPMPGVTVTALRFGYSLIGERMLSSGFGSDTTDDRGVYRIYGLWSGEYLVMASPRIGLRYDQGQESFDRLTAADVDRTLAIARGVSTGATDSTDRTSAGVASARNTNYAPVFHPATPDVSLATTVVLGEAEERAGIDVVMSFVSTATVTGVLRTATGQPPAPLNVTLSISGGMSDALRNVAREREVRSDADGRFTFRDVAPGRYRVMAKTNPPRVPAGAGGESPFAPATPDVPLMWAQAIIDVNGAPIDLSLDLQPSMTATGRIVFEGATTPPTNVTVLNTRLVPAGSGANIGAGPAGGQVKADRTFLFTGVTPDIYRMTELWRGSWDNWRLKTVTANGRDIYDTPLVVAPGQDVSLVLTYSDLPTEVTGTFQDASGRPAPDYFIVVFPVDRQLWTSIRRLRNTRPASDGVFSVSGLAPGDYFIAALTDFQSEDQFAPSFFEELSRTAARITVTEGQVTRQDVKISR